VTQKLTDFVASGRKPAKKNVSLKVIGRKKEGGSGILLSPKEERGGHFCERSEEAGKIKKDPSTISWGEGATGDNPLGKRKERKRKKLLISRLVANNKGGGVKNTTLYIEREGKELFHPKKSGRGETRCGPFGHQNGESVLGQKSS